MRRLVWWGWGLLSLTLAWAGAGGAEAKPSGAPARGPHFESVTFMVLHRVFHDFRDVQKVKLNQDFPLGDTEYSARVVQYLPDFQMDLKAHKIFSLSDTPRNPAFKVIVRKGKAPQDTSWAFLKSPPHFGARSYFAFHVVRIDFGGGSFMVPDTASAPLPAMPAVAPRDSAKAR